MEAGDGVKVNTATATAHLSGYLQRNCECASNENVPVSARRRWVLGVCVYVRVYVWFPVVGACACVCVDM